MPSSNLRFTAAARLSAALLLAACVSAPASQPVSTAVAYRPRATDALAARIQERIAQLPGAVIGLAYIDLASGDTLYLNADDTFHAASTMKVPVMIELFRAFDAGRLRPDQRLVLGNQFKSIVDGSPYTMGGADGADSLLHRRIGTEVPIIELIEAMITRSSNLATNTLIELVGATNANATAHALGARNIRVLRGVSDNKAFEAGLSNTTTARDLAVLMEAIQRNTAASPASSATMREILLRQEFNGEIPAGLPPGTPVAHKTGWISGVLHDAAIVYPSGRAPYVLVLLSRDIRENEVARPLLVDLSRLVYQHATGVTP
jgi:beta-lactamase class A